MGCKRTTPGRGVRRLALLVLPEGLILGIETSNPSAVEPGCGWSPAVALARHAAGTLTPLGTEALNLDRPQDDDLLPAIDRLFRRAGVLPRDLRAIALSTGPGGFTALRIATASAKMIAEVTGSLVFGVPSACVVARRAECTAPFAVALASKNDSVWLTQFGANTPPIADGQLIHARDFAPATLAALIADRFLPAPFADACAAAGVPILRPVFDPLAVIEVSQRAAAIDPVSLLPIYPREPEAVTKWRALGRE